MRTVPWLIAIVATVVARRARTLAGDAAALESRLAAQIRETKLWQDEARQYFFLSRDLLQRVEAAVPIGLNPLIDTLPAHTEAFGDGYPPLAAVN